MRRRDADSLITSKLLVLQSKRLMLSSIERRLDRQGSDTLRQRAHDLKHQATSAEQAYRNCVLAFGSPDTSGYWLIAYGRMIQMGNAVAFRLRTVADLLPPSERYQASVDVEAIELMVTRWTDSMRESMATSFA